MPWLQTSSVDSVPADPWGTAMAEALTDLVAGATVELRYQPAGAPRDPVPTDVATATADVAGPDGWQTTVVVRPEGRVAQLIAAGDRPSLTELLAALPGAGARAVAQFRRPEEPVGGGSPVPPAQRRALRDTVAVEVLSTYLASRLPVDPRPGLIADTIEYLIELSGTRVESHELTHGVIVTDVVRDDPRLDFAYPADILAAKRAPLLFDGQRSLLVVDPAGRARTELQRHRSERLSYDGERSPVIDDDAAASGSLVADATRHRNGLGFFVRADRSIWTFVDGRPLLVRRGEHWTAFPLELDASISNMIGEAAVSALVTRTAFMISARPHGAILAIVDDPADLDGVVSPKDRYDLRDEIDPTAMRPETRLHHLIDAEDLDEHTLARLATLDGATVLDRDGRLLAYGAIVTSADSQYEGARTAAARTLSVSAAVVLKVSVDGDITIFRSGVALATLLGRPSAPRG